MEIHEGRPRWAPLPWTPVRAGIAPARHRTLAKYLSCAHRCTSGRNTTSNPRGQLAGRRVDRIRCDIARKAIRGEQERTAPVERQNVRARSAGRSRRAGRRRERRAYPAAADAVHPDAITGPVGHHIIACRMEHTVNRPRQTRRERVARCRAWRAAAGGEDTRAAGKICHKQSATVIGGVGQGIVCAGLDWRAWQQGERASRSIDAKAEELGAGSAAGVHIVAVATEGARVIPIP